MHRTKMSELIRRLFTTQPEKKEEKSHNTETFFAHMSPLEGLADTQPEAWVRELRSTSRILR